MINSTCPIETKPNDPIPFYSNGNFNFKVHNVGWIICGFLTLISSITSFYLIFQHLTFYSKPNQQRHIIRMLIMVPIYSIISTLSFIFFKEAIYYETIRDCYEAVVITSFFILLLQFIGENSFEQIEIFKNLKLKKWFWPLGFWRYRPDGLHFLFLMKILILQYSIIRPISTIIAVILQYFQIYCLESWNPKFGHIYISIIISISVSVAMYCLIQFYLSIQLQLKPYSPILKFFSIKSIVFLTFWQDSFLSILVYFGVIKETQYMTSSDVQIGINALLECFEMTIFAFLHLKAFSYEIYKPKNKNLKTIRWKAFLDVLDFRDWYYEMTQTSRYYYSKSSKNKTFTIVEEIEKEKFIHLEKALGKNKFIQFQLQQQNRQLKEMPNFWRKGCKPEENDQENENQDEEKLEKQFYNEENEKLNYKEENENEIIEIPTLPNFDLNFNLEELSPIIPIYNDEENNYNNTYNEEKEEFDIFIPRKGGKAKREASETMLGAFWRKFRERSLEGKFERGREIMQEQQQREVEQQHEVEQQLEVGKQHLMEETPSPTPISTFQLQKQASLGHCEKQKWKKVATGYSGKAIDIVLPSPLSPEGNVLESSSSSSIVPNKAITTSKYIGSQSSNSKIRFTDIKTPLKDPKDDPEADPINRNGWVIAGNKSLKQIKLEEEEKRLRKQRLEEEERLKQRSDQRKIESRKNMAGIGVSHHHHHHQQQQHHFSPPSILTRPGMQSFNSNTFQQQNPTNHQTESNHRHQTQSNRPHHTESNRRHTIVMPPVMMTSSRNTIQQNHQQRRLNNTPPSWPIPPTSSSNRSRTVDFSQFETREGFHFEYID